MRRNELARADLKDILDRLGPGLWLSADDRVLSGIFGADNTVEVARAFAEQHGCAFQYEPGTQRGDGVGVFGRVLFKTESG